MSILLEGSKIYLAEEDIDNPTGGNFQETTLVLDVSDTSGWQDFDFSWPIPIAMLAAGYNSTSLHTGDKVEFVVAPDTTIGSLTSSSAVDDSTFSVSQSVIDNVVVGYYLTIDTEDLSRVTGIDKGALTVTTNSSATSAHTVNDLVKVSVKMAQGMEIGHSGPNSIGLAKIGGSRIEADTVVRVRYDNVSGGAKKLYINLEYLY